MPKYPKRSRWILFNIKGSLDPLPYIRKCSPKTCQYYCIDDSITGYLYFENPRMIPNVPWIPGAKLEFTDKDTITGLYTSVPMASWINYGIDFVFVPKVVTPAPLKPIPKVAKPSANNDSDSEDDNPPLSFKLAGLLLHPQAVRIARDYTDMDFVAEVLEPLTDTQKAIVFADLAHIEKHHPLFMAAYDRAIVASKKPAYKCPYFGLFK